MMTERKHHPARSLLAIGLLLPCMTIGQTYPAKPIRILVGFAAGGSTDLVARVSATKMNAALGQPVVVENRAGAGGNIAAELVAKSPPDGHVFLVTPSSFAVNPSLYKQVPYDAMKDFAPVTQLSSYMLFLICHPSIPARSIRELITLAKAKPGQLNFGSAGTGTTTHIAGELLAYMERIQIQHIAFRGTGQQLPATISGEVALGFGSTTVVPYIQTRRLVALGVTGAKRFPTLPEIPTIGETVKGYEVDSWNAMFAPAGTPPAILKRVSEIIVKGLKEKDTMEVFEKQGLQDGSGTPEDLGSLVAQEMPKWAKVIRAANIPLQ